MRFVIYRAQNAQYYFVIKSSNGEIVATSETYYAKSSAKSTIDSIKREVGPSSIVIDMTD